jgi:phage replication-related protein YjqB (UPF0714/DUF867 family)
MSNVEENYFETQFELDPRQPNDRLFKEHCMANRDKILSIGRNRNQQVRIEFRRENDVTTSAIYTVSVFHSDQDRVILGHKIPNLNCKLDGNKCKGVVKAQIMIEGIEEQDAKDTGELIEDLKHEAQNNKLLVIAPHGGEIERMTDNQAELVWSHFSSARASLWTCKGFSIEGQEGALSRWHITSTEISKESFPQLNTILGPTPTFEYSIAFHGWNEDKDVICVGGKDNQTSRDLKKRIRDAIDDALPNNANIRVLDSGCPEGFNGNDPYNIVNKLGTNGIQIEQCPKARDQFHDVIAQAVVKVIDPLINA